MAVEKRGGLGCGGAVMIVLALLVVMLWWAWPSDEDQRAAREAVLAGPQQETATADEFRQAYQDNEVAAKARFDGKAIKLTGIVTGVRESNDDELVVSFATKDGVGVEASVAGEDRNAATRLKPGASASVHCARLLEVIGVRVLAECRLTSGVR